MAEEKLNVQNKTSKSNLKETAGIALTADDLIHPHEASNLPGYCGYTPQLKFNCGHTYGYHTDKLSNKYTKNEKLVYTRSDNYADRSYFIPPEGGDRRYVEKMVPGYTGFVPQHSFKYGQTYKEGTEEAISEFMQSDYLKRKGQLELTETVRSFPKLTVRPDYPHADPSHPGMNIRYAYAYNRKHFDEKRNFTEAPMPGYKGYVPRQEEHKLGGRYGIWTKYAYSDAMQSMTNGDSMKTKKIDVADFKPAKHIHTSTWPLPDTGNQRFGSVYNKRLGMVPNYTGFVPQRRYDFGDTYADSTRTLPVCYDTNGYSTGKYNNHGPPIQRTVIPARI